MAPDLADETGRETQDELNYKSAIENEGVDALVDTTDILASVEPEELSREEILDIRSKIGKYKCYVQMKKLAFDEAFCHLRLYRIIVLGRLSSRDSRFVSEFNEEFKSKDYRESVLSSQMSIPN